MKKTILFMILLTLLIGCAKTPAEAPEQPREEPKEVDYNICVIDEDCICGGVDAISGKCFLGNIEYYEKYVDKSKQCPDFCRGIDGNLVIRCINGKCSQMYECLMDFDCDPGKKCIRNRCT